jgi:hypothetical protein
LNFITSNAVLQVEAMATAIAGTGMVGVISGEHGSGKSIAGTWAKSQIEASEARPRVLQITCTRGGNPGMFAKYLAKALAIEIKGNLNPLMAFDKIKARLLRGDYRLIIADDVHHLDSACQEHLIRLIEPASLQVDHRTGLLVIEHSGAEAKSFSNFASGFGYRPVGMTMPKLITADIAEFLMMAFPQVEDIDTAMKSDEGQLLLRDLSIQSQRLPRSLENLLQSISLDQSFPAIPSLQDVQEGLNRICGKPTSRAKSRISKSSDHPAGS